MENYIKITPQINKKRIEYIYDISGEWSEAFNIDGISGWFGNVSNGEYKFFCEFETSMEDVPPSVALIPILSNILPIAWLYGATIRIDEIDSDFLSSIDLIKKAYAEMYPELDFKEVRIIFDKISQTKIGRPRSTPIVLFSGGVDAVFTMLGNKAISPLLVNIWGADMFFKNVPAWEKVKQDSRALGESLGLPFTYVKSSFRFFIKYSVLDEKFAKRVKDNWWHGFQHGIGLLGLVAPLAWKQGRDLVFISSSFSSKDPYVSRAASDPTVDNNLRFSGIGCRHYDYNVDRQDKIKFICDESKRLGKKVPLRVCWKRTDGTNCCLCEKCLRTIMAIYAEGADPNDFGFFLDETIEGEIINQIDNGVILKQKPVWSLIARRFQETTPDSMNLPHVKAFIADFPLPKSVI